MCPIRSKQQQLQPTDSEQQKKAVLSSRAKDVCHFHHKYKAEEEFFNVLKPTEIMSLACIFCTYFVYMLYVHTDITILELKFTI